MNQLIKKLLITSLAVLPIICYSTSVFATGFDFNADNKVDVNDVTYLQNALSNFAEDTKLDLNSDGRIDVNDVSFLQIEISIHQYSWNGKVDGISEKVDMNYIYNLNC